ncbi:MAG: integrase [Mesorhizobium sp.]|uniref:tyrosine-type recombinase/integrase n=1 Tax=Mesorhizobium sp. TaxID=1871066 RepID=UPI0012240EC8|nr:tyrosine-type recombinase/integrase [Mesorhizobium sp.]TIR49074.1 MAG: integrase [Mesorhizobium sp.]
MENPPPKPAKNDLPADDPLDGDPLEGELPDIVDLVIEMGRPTPRVPAHVEDLVETATDYANNASSQNTRDAYAKDWRHFSSWCRRNGFDPLPPDPKVIGLYISACAAGGQKLGAPALSVSTIERRLSGLSWNFTQRGFVLDRADRHIATVLAGIRRKHARPPRVKEAVLGDDLLAMIATLGHDLRGLRDRAILLLGFAGGLRRSEIVGLDVTREDNSDGAGWIEIFPDKGVLVTLRGKTGWREVEVGRGSSDHSCPVVALETWIKYGRIARGPLFRRIFKDSKTVDVERLSDKHVARLVKQTALAAGVRADLPDAERALLFAGHSLRAGLASSADIEERYVQKQLGHASAEMTRKYQRRRDRFRTNLTKASGL